MGELLSGHCYLNLPKRSDGKAIHFSVSQIYCMASVDSFFVISEAIQVSGNISYCKIRKIQNSPSRHIFV